jgi:hypothetical protein
MDSKRRRTIAHTNSDSNPYRKSNSIHAAFRYAASYSDAQASPHAGTAFIGEDGSTKMKS